MHYGCKIYLYNRLPLVSEIPNDGGTFILRNARHLGVMNVGGWGSCSSSRIAHEFGVVVLVEVYG
jgi:hypothetical protein